ncbi:MAG: hypothetical protein U9N14_00950 [Pseudomonadota bacterium]|nr:hypothetical protein [Pseudomonadota bacterium]
MNTFHLTPERIALRIAEMTRGTQKFRSQSGSWNAALGLITAAGIGLTIAGAVIPGVAMAGASGMALHHRGKSNKKTGQLRKMMLFAAGRHSGLHLTLSWTRRPEVPNMDKLIGKPSTILHVNLHPKDFMLFSTILDEPEFRAGIVSARMDLANNRRVPVSAYPGRILLCLDDQTMEAMNTALKRIKSQRLKFNIYSHHDLNI